MSLKPTKKKKPKSKTKKKGADFSDPTKSYPSLGITRANNWKELHNVRPKLQAQVMMAQKNAMSECNISQVNNEESFLYEDHPRESSIRLEWRMKFIHPKGSKPHQHGVNDFTDAFKRNLQAVEGFENVIFHTGRYGRDESSIFVNVWLEREK